MATLVLIGFSCAGKTDDARATVKLLKKQGIATAVVVDSDKWIAKHAGRTNVWDIHYRYGRDEALRRIEAAERLFLNSRQPTDEVEVIAAGPFLPVREPEWSDFVARAQPSIAYLKVSATEATKRLLGRRRGMLKKSQHKNASFGCWDEDVLTDFIDGKWSESDPAVIEKRITTHLSRLDPVYERWQTLGPVNGPDRLDIITAAVLP